MPKTKIHTLPLLDAVSASRKVPVYKARREDGMNANWVSVPSAEQHLHGLFWWFGISVVWDLNKLGLAR